MSNRMLTEKLRAEILSQGMDLVGFAPVARWEYAPFLLSPQAVLPTSKTVIVAAIHITDTWTEMGGEPEPQDLGPGGWLDQNSLLDRIAYRTVRALNDAGYQAIGIASSNIWRYREFEGIPSLFAPDLSHIHAATAAGLAEIGWSGLAITPEFGSRCRFISIVTDADLVPTPMYNGPALCDMCMDCVKHCPTASLSKELKKPHEVKIGGKVYKYANKNIWRCAWAEHFNLDLNSDTLNTVEKIDEKVIMKELMREGVKGHERGVCQKVCVPPHLRTKKLSFGRNQMIAQNRINQRYPDSMPTLRKMRDDLKAYAIKFGAELIEVAPLDINSKAGKIAIKEAPGMKTVMAFAFRIPKDFQNSELPNEEKAIYGHSYGYRMHHLLIRMVRQIEDYGYNATPYTGNWNNILEYDAANEIIDLGEIRSFKIADAGPLAQRYGMGEALSAMTNLGELDTNGKFNTSEFGYNVMVGAVTTNVIIDSDSEDTKVQQVNLNPCLKGIELKNELEFIAKGNMISSFGVADYASFDHTVEDLKMAVNEEHLGESIIDGAKLNYHGPFESEIIKEDKKLKLPKDYLTEGKSVIVLGMHFPMELINNSGKEDTQQIGTYAFHQYQTCFELRFAAIKLVDYLSKMGYKAKVTEDMLGIGSLVDTPRGKLPDARCNALEGFAAGLGTIGKNGALLTEKYGPHQRRIVIVTDAELPKNEVYKGEKLCQDCNECITKCPMQAFEEKSIPVRINNIEIPYPIIERHRCDWSKLYSLCSEEGPALIGNNTNVKAPSKRVNIEDLALACNEKDPIMKSRTCILETCLRQCPAGNK